MQAIAPSAVLAARAGALRGICHAGHRAFGARARCEEALRGICHAGHRAFGAGARCGEALRAGGGAYGEM